MSPPVGQRIGNDTSFERLYRLHRRDVYGAVLRDLRDPDEAEDVTQIAFLNAFRAMRRGEQPDKPRAWLVTIARNVIRRRYRDLMRRPQEVALDPDVAVALLEVDGPTANEIAAAIRRIPENQRTAILLREIQGRSYAEIAEKMDLSVAAVETLIFRARRSLSEELELVDRVPTTQRRSRVLAFLPLPGFGKLSLGLSFGRAGAAALVGSVAMVAVPLGSDAEPSRPPAVQRGPSTAEMAGPAVVSPTGGAAPAVAAQAKRRADKPKHAPAAGTQNKDAPDDSDSSGTPLSALEVPVLPPLSTPTVPTVEVPSVEVPSLPLEDPSLPPLPLDPLPDPELPPLTG